MELEKALDQISEIHGYLARSEVYRGYRSLPLLASGALAIGAATVQATLLVPDRPEEFVAFWLAVAVVCAAVSSVEVAYHFFFRDDALRRQKTRRLVGQFLPALGAGLVTTLCLLRLGPQAAPLIPGLWGVHFGLGVFACRPYLPRNIGWVALWHVGSGALLLALSGTGAVWSPWWTGVPFALGQALAALVLWRDIERRADV